MNNIPKIIHYCWFGKGEKNELVKKCIASWKKNLEGYEIIEWNEKNFDVNINQYTKEAYEMKKWAFVSDYIRLYALYNYGGIYLDTDVEVIKSFDQFLDFNVFLGFQSDKSILTAVIGSKEKHIFIKKLFEKYKNKHFIENGIMKMETNNELLTEVCVKEFKLKQDNSRQVLEKEIQVFPKEYFSIGTNKEKNYSIHYGDASWFSYDRAIAELKSYRSYYFYLLEMVNNLIEERSIRKDLLNESIAIYGNGQLGHMLVKLFEKSGVKPRCIIDKKNEYKDYKGIPVVKLKELSNYSVNKIVITPIAYFDEIAKDIRKSSNNIEIISIEEIYKEKI